PVLTETVDAAALEVVRSESKRDTAPVIRAAAEHARSKPVERRTGRVGIRFAIEVPTADAAIEFAEWFLRSRCAAAWRLVRPCEHFGILFGIPHRSRFEQSDIRARLRQNFRGHTSAGARSNDANVICFWFFDYLHRGVVYITETTDANNSAAHN